jgi:riboflavin synthase
MFTGIIETIGTVKEVIINGSNRTFWVESPISDQFKIDQSVSHSGVCLTVEEVKDKMHRVTAIDETLQKTILGSWDTSTLVNLERSVQMGQRLDGHIVQGHVDTTGQCIKRKEKEGSWEFTIEFPKSFAELVIEKGSIAVNGISLTAFNVKKKSFCVAIIPYTFEHTNIRAIQKGEPVNLEFDMVGKYLLRRLTLNEE